MKSLLTSGQAKGKFDHTVADPGFSFGGTDPAGGGAATQALFSENIHVKTKEFAPFWGRTRTDGTLCIRQYDMYPVSRLDLRILKSYIADCFHTFK